MPSSITPELVYELVSVASPSLSPDGGRLAFVRSQVDRKSMEARSQIMVLKYGVGREFAVHQRQKRLQPEDSRPTGSISRSSGLTTLASPRYGSCPRAAARRAG